MLVGRPIDEARLRRALGRVVAHAGTARFPLADRIDAVPAADLIVGGLD